MCGQCVPNSRSWHLEALSLCRTELVATQCTHLVKTGQALQVIDCTLGWRAGLHWRCGGSCGVSVLQVPGGSAAAAVCKVHAAIFEGHWEAEGEDVDPFQE